MNKNNVLGDGVHDDSADNADNATDTNSDRLRHVLARTVPDENMQMSSIDDLIRTVEENEAHTAVQHLKVADILLETLEDAALGDKHVDFNIKSLLQTTSSELADNDLFDDLAINERLNDATIPGRYDVLGLLGSGASGQVFAVYDNNFDRNIAVKFMHPDDAHNQKKLLRFIDEASITAKLTHPNILPVHDLDYTDGALIYFSMGRADGASLQDILDATNNDTTLIQFQDINDRVRIILQVCNAIAYAHSQGIVHHDIKPSNIMVGEYGETLVVDWGTASTPTQREKHPKRMLGTPIYMSPEQARREPSDERSDIYCLGSTLFHLLTLRFPCWNDDLDLFWDNKCNGVYQHATAAEHKKIPHALLSITEKAMAPKVKDRYQSVEAMMLDLEHFLQGVAVSAHHDSVTEIVKRVYKKEPRVIYAAILGLICIITAIGWLYYEKTLEHTRWISAYHSDFNHDSASSIENTWQAQLLPGWEASNAQALNGIVGSDNYIGNYFIIRDGSLQLIKDYRLLGCINLSYKKRIPGNMRITWDYRAEHEFANLNCYIGGSNRKIAYTFHVGGFGSAQNITLTKGNEVLSTGTLAHEITQDETYTFQMLKTDTYVSLSINNIEVMHHVDPDMLVGTQHQHFGFDLLTGTTVIDNLNIEYQPLPQKISPITVAHHYFSSGLYAEALVHYQKIRAAYSDSDMAVVALYRIGRCYSELGQHDDAQLHFKQFLQLYPTHQLSDHVVLQYANSLCVDRAWNVLRTVISTYNIDEKSQSIRQSLLAAIDAALAARFNNPLHITNAAHAPYKRFQLENRNLASVRDDIDFVLKMQQQFHQQLKIKLSPERNAVLGSISEVSGDFFGSRKRVYDIIGRKSRGRLLDLVAVGDFKAALEDFPDDTIFILLNAGHYKKLRVMLKEDSRRFQHITLQGGYIGNPEYVVFITELASAFPDRRDLQAQLLFTHKRYQKIIDTYPDQPALYLQSLEFLGRYQEILDLFTNTGGVFNLHWLRARVLCKLSLFEEALALEEKKDSPFSTNYTSFILSLQALDRYLKGDQQAFHAFENNELLYIQGDVVLRLFRPFLLLKYHNTETTLQAYRDVLSWNTTHNLTSSQSSIQYIIGEIDQETYRARVQKRISADAFSTPSRYCLETAMRLDLQGHVSEAIRHYTIANELLEFESQRICEWRLKVLQNK